MKTGRPITKSSKPVLIRSTKCHVVKVCGQRYKMTIEQYNMIKDEYFKWNSQAKNNIYPISIHKDRRGHKLPSVLFGGVCYTKSADRFDLRPENLMAKTEITYIDDNTLKVWIGNGIFFLADVKHRNYIESRKWSWLRLGKKYWYACAMDPDTKKLILFHRYVMGATRKSQVCNHLNWQTNDNRDSNLEITTLRKNFLWRNPEGSK